MKQKFIIETDEGISDMELCGCLEDTIGRNILSVEEIEQ